jgi:phenol 2-monooxygenase
VGISHFASLMLRWKRPRETLAFSGLYTGIGVRYQASLAINGARQELAKNVVIGERVPLGSVVRAADGRTYHIHDLITSDSHFKLFVFAGNIRGSAKAEYLRLLHKALQSPITETSRIAKKEEILKTCVIAYGLDGVSTFTQVDDLTAVGWTKCVVIAKQLDASFSRPSASSSMRRML